MSTKPHPVPLHPSINPETVWARLNRLANQGPGAATILSATRLGLHLRLLRATDGGWWHTKPSGRRVTYRLAICQVVSREGIRCWMLVAWTLKLYVGRVGQRPVTG